MASLCYSDYVAKLAAISVDASLVDFGLCMGFCSVAAALSNPLDTIEAIVESACCPMCIVPIEVVDSGPDRISMDILADSFVFVVASDIDVASASGGGDADLEPHGAVGLVWYEHGADL